MHRTDLADLSIQSLELGKPLAGDAVSLVVKGHAHLRSLQDATAYVVARRTGGDGDYEINLHFDPARMDAILKLQEPANGPLENLVKVPGLGALSVIARLNGPRNAEQLQLSVDAGPLRARAHGTLDLVHSAANLDYSLTAPAMTPYAGLAWESVELNGRFHGPFTTPTADGRLLITALRVPGGQPLVWVAALECALIAAMLVLLLTLRLDSETASGTLVTTLFGVAAMGVQSAMVRLFMRDVPSTNVMTTNTTQLAVDVTLVLLSLGRQPAGEADARQDRAARERCRCYWPPMAGFVLGTAIGALCFQFVGKAALGVGLGDFGLAIRRDTGAHGAFFFADAGSGSKIGEMSTMLFRALFPGNNQEEHLVSFIVFPGSRLSPIADNPRPTLLRLLSDLSNTSNVGTMIDIMASGTRRPLKNVNKHACITIPTDARINDKKVQSLVIRGNR